MLAIGFMSATPKAIFYVVAVLLFILAGIGGKAAGERVNLLALGLAAAFFPLMWDSLAAT